MALDNMTVVELRKLCKKNGVTGYSGKRKAWLVDNCGGKAKGPAPRRRASGKAKGKSAASRRRALGTVKIKTCPCCAVYLGEDGECIKLVKDALRPSARCMYDKGHMSVGDTATYNGVTKCLKLRKDGRPFFSTAC